MTTDTSTSSTGVAPAFGELRQVDAGVLNVGYVEAGPADGPAVLLLHGWPYDIHAYAEATPPLASAGYRVIVPYLRGYGATTFLSDSTPRNGQQAALGVDGIALLDALGVDEAALVGCSMGGSIAIDATITHPDRVWSLVPVAAGLGGIEEPGAR